MRESKQRIQRSCWCGNEKLAEFCADYCLCRSCGTLVSQAGLANEDYVSKEDESGFYGKSYWLDKRDDELALPRIQDRARLDLPERCVYWLRHLLTFHLPPAKVLEMGASHGGFVALMGLAGYDAVGLEMSPWVADFARTTFRVPMLLGGIEKQALMPGSFDIVVANDVMEHLPDPLTTLGAAVKLLGPKGILVIQMPEFVEGKSHAERVAHKERFLEHTRRPDEHLYLYSQRAARLCLARLGLEHVAFFPAIFDYDMYLVASRQTLQCRSTEDMEAFLQETPQGRLLLALIDRAQDNQRLTGKWLEAEGNNTSHLQNMKDLEHQLAVSEADRAARLRKMKKLEQMVRASQEDSVARLRAIEELGHKVIAAEEQMKAANRALHEQEQAIRKHITTIRTLQKALKLSRTPLPQRQFGLNWKGKAKRFAKLLLPGALRRHFREIVAGGTAYQLEESAPSKISKDSH